jgi:hypothetical protein
MDAAEYSRTIRQATSGEERVAWFGALLGSESETKVEIVGGSAVEVYLSSIRYVSQDIDLVGQRVAVEGALRKWDFRTLTGRSERTYWTDGFVGLVDIVGPADRSGLAPRKIATSHGPVLLSAPEPLIVRRLYRSKREGSEELFRQAVALGRLGDLDWEYIESEARYENVETELRKLRKQISPGPTR